MYKHNIRLGCASFTNTYLVCSLPHIWPTWKYTFGLMCINYTQTTRIEVCPISVLLLVSSRFNTTMHRWIASKIAAFFVAKILWAKWILLKVVEQFSPFIWQIGLKQSISFEIHYYTEAVDEIIDSKNAF